MLRLESFGSYQQLGKSKMNRMGADMAQQYSPGEIVPRDGTVECKQFSGTKDSVKKGTKFAPCDHWGQHNGKACTWEYVD